MKKTIVFFLGILLVVGAAVLSNPQEETKKVDINVFEALELIEQYEESEIFILLDVRTPAEFKAGHLEGAIKLDFYDPEFREKLAELDRDFVYLVYCRSGNRSASALRIMEELGFNEAYNLLGGIIAWEAEGLEIFKPEESE